jgi:hypothetical protein
MSDSPSSDQPETYSTWQHNATAIKAVHYFAAQRLRDTCVAIISGLGTG